MTDGEHDLWLLVSLVTIRACGSYGVYRGTRGLTSLWQSSVSGWSYGNGALSPQHAHINPEPLVWVMAREAGVTWQVEIRVLVRSGPLVRPLVDKARPWSVRGLPAFELIPGSGYCTVSFSFAGPVFGDIF